MDDLLQWALSEGCELPLLEVVGRQLVAAADVAGGSCILSVPQHILLHDGHAWEHPTHGRAFSQLKEEIKAALDRRWMLCLLLILERARSTASKWHTYINILPIRYEDPLWWSREELELLRGTRPGATVAFYEKGIQSLREWRARLCSIQRELGGSDTIRESPWAMSDEALAWAKSTVWSRAFNIKCLGGMGREGIALVPVLDMLDHSPAAHVAWHTGPTGTDNFQFITHSATKQGEVVYTNYGYKSNEELIVGYGFVLDPNPADFLHISMALGAGPAGSSAAEGGDPGGAERVARLRALLHRLGLATTHYLTRGQPLPPALAAAAAVCLLPDQHAYALLAQVAAPATHEADPSSSQAAAAQQGKAPLALVGLTGAAHENTAAVPGTVEVCPAPACAAAAPAAGSKPFTGEAAASGIPLDVPLASRLVALRTLRTQLQRKVAEMEGGSRADDLALLCAAEPGTATHMALVYRATQKEIAEAALHRIGQEASALLRDASAVSQFEPTQLQAPQSQDCRKHSFLGSDGCVQTQWVLESCLKKRGGSCSKLNQRWAVACDEPWGWGLALEGDVHQGQELACIPLAAGFAGADEQELAVALAVKYMYGADDPPSQPDDSETDDDYDVGLNTLINTISHINQPNSEPCVSRAESQEAIDALAGTPAASILVEEQRRLAAQVKALTVPLKAALKDRVPSRSAARLSQRCADTFLAPGVTMARARHVLEWALAVVERCALPGPAGGSSLAVLPFACALPKELRGLVIDISWEQRGGHSIAILTAAAPMAKGMLLCPWLWMQGLPWERLLTQWGLSHLNKPIEDANEDEGSCGWASHASCAYEICMDVPDGHPFAEQCRALLDASATGRTHWLTTTTPQERLLAAVAICAADPQDLDRMGGHRLSHLFSRAWQSAEATATAAPSVSGVGSSGVSQEEVAAELAKAQQGLLIALLGDKRLMRTARQTLTSLLQHARAELQHGQVQIEIRFPGVRQYHTAMLNIVQHHLRVLADRKRAERSQAAEGKQNKKKRA